MGSATATSRFPLPTILVVLTTAILAAWAAAWRAPATLLSLS